MHYNDILKVENNKKLQNESRTVLFTHSNKLIFTLKCFGL